jgi:hypothetical protein
MEKNAYKIFVEKPGQKRQLERPSHRNQDGISADIIELGREVWTGLIWLGLVSTVPCGHSDEHSGPIESGNFLE